VYRQPKGKINGSHDDNKSAQQNGPLPPSPEAAHEEEKYRSFAEGNAHQVPRLSQHIEFQGPRRVRRSALEDAKDNPY
jgi:hypothetical protein